MILKAPRSPRSIVSSHERDMSSRMKQASAVFLASIVSSSVIGCVGSGADTEPSSRSPGSPRAQEPVKGGVLPDAPGGEPTSEADRCEVDADCVPAACCHPTTCVAVSSAPSCSDAVCNDGCEPFSLDCGGRCACDEAGRCSAIFKPQPSWERMKALKGE